MQTKEVQMNTEAQERRSWRSSHPRIAMQYQLEHVQEVLGLTAIVLADDLGETLASAGPEEIVQVLSDAAMWTGEDGPAIDTMAEDELNALLPGLKPADVVATSIYLEGMDSYCRIVAVGASKCRQVAVDHAARGVQRIARQTVGAPLLSHSF